LAATSLVLAQTTDERASLPAIGQLTSDALPDLGVLLGGALWVNRSRPGRSFVPTTYPTFAPPVVNLRALFLDAIPPTTDDSGKTFGSGDELIVLWDGDPNDQTRVVAPRVPGEWKGWSFPGAMLATTSVAAGDFDQSSPCAELVFAQANDTKVRIVPMCAFDATAPPSGKWVWNEQTDPVNNPWLFAKPATVLDLSDVVPNGTIGLNGGAGIPDALRLANVDRDAAGCLDLVVAGLGGLVATSAGGTTESLEPLVAYGNCLGAFQSPQAALATLGPPMEEQWNAGNGRFPLALGHLNEDTRIDLVYDTSIVMSALPDAGNPNAPTYSEYFFGQQWSAARVVDMNHDGLLDVVAISAITPELYFLQAAAGGAFSPFVVPLGGQPKSLGTGDFDGDGLLDVALAEAPTQSGAGQDTATGVEDLLTVAFGNAFGPPSEPISVGNLQSIEWIASGNLQAGDYLDAVHDLAVGLRYSAASGGRPGVTVLPGSGNRQLMAPFFFSRDRDDPAAPGVNDPPIAVSIGDFSTYVSGHGDVAAIATTRDVTQPCSGDLGQQATGADYLWLVPSSGEASLDLARKEYLDLATVSAAVGWRYAAMARIDVGDPPGDELVVLAPTRNADNQALAGALAVFHASSQPHSDREQWILAGLDGGTTGEVFPLPESYLRWRGRCSVATAANAETVDVDGGAAGSPPGNPVQPTATSVTDSVLQIVDVDGDGKEDLAALGFEPGSPNPAAVQGSPVVTLFLNEGRGALDPNRRAIVRFLDTMVVRSFAFLELDGDRAKELAVATDDGVFLLELTLDTTPTPPEIQIVRAWPAAAPDASGLALLQVIAGDFDGDGVEDLAYTRTLDGAVLVRLGVPARR
jgi:hypothetical protein